MSLHLILARTVACFYSFLQVMVVGQNLHQKVQLESLGLWRWQNKSIKMLTKTVVYSSVIITTFKRFLELRYELLYTTKIR